MLFVFDLDDTLYDTCMPFYKLLQQHCPSLYSKRAAIYRRFREHAITAFDAVQQGRWSLVESHQWRMQQAFRDFHISLDAATAQQWQNHYASNQQSILLDPDMQRLLEQLSAHHCPFAILTNGPHKGQTNKLHALGMEQWCPPSHWFVSEQLGVAKPDQRAFLAVIQRLPNDHDFVMIGDSYRHDICGAALLGWTTIWLNLHNASIDQIVPSYTVSTRQQLAHCVAQLAGFTLA